MTQLDFNVICTAIDLLQVAQEQCCCTIQDLEQKPRLFIRVERRQLV